MKLSKCSRCGCEGIHACLGDTNNSLDTADETLYHERLQAAIASVLKDESESNNDKQNRSS